MERLEFAPANGSEDRSGEWTVSVSHAVAGQFDTPFQDTSPQVATLAVMALICLRLLLQIFGHYGGTDSLWYGMEETLAENGSVFVDHFKIDRDEVGIAMISLFIVVALLALMMTGMPLGIVTLIISVTCALVFYGTTGMYLVSTNALDLLEKYPLVAVPFFVLMASILERAGIAQDLFDAMSIFAGGLRGGVALQTTVVAVILAAMSGVMGGEIVMLGLVALPQMLRLGYDRKLTIGLICAVRCSGDTDTALDRHDRLRPERQCRHWRPVFGRFHSRPHACRILRFLRS